MGDISRTVRDRFRLPLKTIATKRPYPPDFFLAYNQLTRSSTKSSLLPRTADLREESGLPQRNECSYMRKTWINADKSHLWKDDISASVDQFNQWFMQFAPKAFRSTRLKTTTLVKDALLATRDLSTLMRQHSRPIRVRSRRFACVQLRRWQLIG